MANITFSEASGVNDSIFGKSQAPIRMFIEKRGEQFEQQSVVQQDHGGGGVEGFLLHLTEDH